MKLNDLTIEKESHKILSHISVELNSNCIGVIGGNGQGKTTLLNAIIEKDEYLGEITLRPEFSYAGHISDMNTELYVREILEYSVINSGTDLWGFEEILKVFDLTHLKDHSFNTLSGGEKQRVNLACSLYQKSDLVIWDEPTNYLDPRHIKSLIDIVLKEKMRRKFLIVSHHMNFIISVSEMILGLKDRELKFYENTYTAFDKKLFNEIFDISFNYMVNDQKRSVTI